MIAVTKEELQEVSEIVARAMPHWTDKGRAFETYLKREFQFSRCGSTPDGKMTWAAGPTEERALIWEAPIDYIARTPFQEIAAYMREDISRLLDAK